VTCHCGALDCPSCGPAQGVRGRWIRFPGGKRWVSELDDDTDLDAIEEAAADACMTIEEANRDLHA
jgi:NMD protein affecting ribosome stability and mRNA decay